MSIVSFLFTPFIDPDLIFMRRALTGGLALALGSSPLGVLLIQRRMSLVGDAMSHAILPGAAIAYFFYGLSLLAMTIGGIVAGLLVATCASLVSRLTTLKEDASFATFYLISLALGVLIISLRGTSKDLLHVLFGAVLALDNATLLMAAGIATFSMLTLALMYRPLLIQSFAPEFLATKGVWNGLTYAVFLLLLVLNLVGGFHTLGTLMAVAFMVLPACSARFWVASAAQQMLLSIVFAILATYVGLLISYHSHAVSIAASPAIVLTLGIIYLISILLGSLHGVITRKK